MVPNAPVGGAIQPRRRRSLWTKLTVSAVGTLAGLLLLEGAAHVVVAWRAALWQRTGNRDEYHCEYDPDLGWRHMRSHFVRNLYGDGKDFTSNGQHMRSTTEYTREKPPGKYRIVCLGDSFTMGHGVSDDESYPAQLGRLCPEIDALNMGMAGYGVDQDYLWFKRDGLAFDADMLVFAFIADDFYRMQVDTLGGRWPKPMLRVSDGALEALNVPVPNRWWNAGLARRSASFFRKLALVEVAGKLVSRARPESASEASPAGASDDSVPRADVAAAILRDLKQVCQARGQEFVLVYLPSKDTMPTEPGAVGRWVEEFARQEGIAFVNFAPELQAITPERADLYYLPSDHFTEFGNQLVASTLLRELRAKFAEVPR